MSESTDLNVVFRHKDHLGLAIPSSPHPPSHLHRPRRRTSTSLLPNVLDHQGTGNWPSTMAISQRHSSGSSSNMPKSRLHMKESTGRNLHRHSCSIYTRGGAIDLRDSEVWRWWVGLRFRKIPRNQRCMSPVMRLPAEPSWAMSLRLSGKPNTEGLLVNHDSLERQWSVSVLPTTLDISSSLRPSRLEIGLRMLAGWNLQVVLV